MGWPVGSAGLGEGVVEQAGDQLGAHLLGQVAHDREGNAAVGQGVRAGPAGDRLGNGARVVAPGQGELAEAGALLDQPGMNLAFVHRWGALLGLSCTQYV